VDPAVAALGRDLILAGGRDVTRAIVRTTPELRSRRRWGLGVFVAAAVLLPVSLKYQNVTLASFACAAMILSVLFQMIAVQGAAWLKLSEMREQIRDEKAPRPPSRSPKETA
jgi:hypothetical protein